MYLHRSRISRAALCVLLTLFLSLDQHQVIIATIAAAIVHAAERGVAIRNCVDAPGPSGQKMAHDSIRGWLQNKIAIDCGISGLAGNALLKLRGRDRVLR